jgi:hypothetical protein
MRKLKSVLILLMFIHFFSDNILYAWDDDITHPDLSDIAARKSVLGVQDYLKNIGFSKGLDEKVNGKELFKWVRDGAKLEDKSDWGFPVLGTTRSVNHFHNPLKPWPQAGLDDWFVLHYTGESSLLWAQDGARQQTYIEGDWSWQKVRNYYYLALTSTSDVERQPNFAKTFRGLGHQIHLIQDAAQPDHVRNDAHPEDTMEAGYGIGIEKWAKKEFQFINSLASAPIFSQVPFNTSYSGLVPITELFDADQYNGDNPSVSLAQGISEYTNANFFSDDTIFVAEVHEVGHRHYFPYPKKTSTDLDDYLAWNKLPETVMGEDGIPDTAFWIKKVADGERIERFLKPVYLSNNIWEAVGVGSLYYRTFYRDEKCHEDYAKKLIPRAVGYSAGLLNYFFRGSIAITLPDKGVYAQTENRDEGFRKVTLRAQNTSPAGEEMPNGSVELVVKYRLAQEDPFQSYPVPTTWEYSYIVVPELNNVRSIPRPSPIKLEFDLSQTPIPINATDLYLLVVYRGKLGQEEGAVAVGFKDISEPTPIDVFNDMDSICINGAWYVAGSPEAIALANQFYFDPYPHNLQNIYIRLSSSTDPKYASSTEYNLRIPSVSAGGFFIRKAFILSDYQFSYSSKETVINADSRDSFITWFEPYIISYGGLKNQTDYVVYDKEEDCALFNLGAPCALYIRYYPTFYAFRDQLMWFEFIYENRSYPVGSSCP